MGKYLLLYLKYSYLLNPIGIFFMIVIIVSIGVLLQNNSNKVNEEDLVGKRMLLSIMFISVLIEAFVAGWAGIRITAGISALWGFGANSLIKKFNKDRVWEKFLWVIDRWAKK